MPKVAAEMIVNYISDRKLQAGEQLPAEIQMAKELGLSRNSVREAYVELISKGAIQRKHGIGTFVSNPVINLSSETVGFWGLIQRSGMTPTLHEITRGRIQSPEDVALIFKHEPGEDVGFLKWLYRADNRPCVLIEHYLRPEIPIDDFNVDRRDVLPDLRKHIDTTGAVLTISTMAAILSGERARLLEIEDGTAVPYELATVTTHHPETSIVSRVWFAPHILHRQQVISLTQDHWSGLIL